jgi:hypothetical protein
MAPSTSVQLRMSSAMRACMALTARISAHVRRAGSGDQLRLQRRAETLDCSGELGERLCLAGNRDERKHEAENASEQADRHADQLCGGIAGRFGLQIATGSRTDHGLQPGAGNLAHARNVTTWRGTYQGQASGGSCWRSGSVTVPNGALILNYIFRSNNGAANATTDFILLRAATGKPQATFIAFQLSYLVTGTCEILK